MVLNELQLNEISSELMKLLWNDSLDIKVQINNRMRTSFGVFYHTEKKKQRIPLNIQISSKLLSGYYKDETIESVIKHELCHYYLYKHGHIEFRDGNKMFEDELKRIGSHPTRTIRYSGLMHICRCSKCNKLHGRYKSERKAKNIIKTKESKCCNSKLIYSGTTIKKDNTRILKSDISVIKKYTKNNLIKTSSLKSINKHINTPINTPKQLKIEDIVILKRKKVSQQNVWDAMLLAVNEKSPEKLKLIKQYYPELFDKICLFIGKKRVEYINSVI